ncbi:MAG TPA: hypothetical protein VIN10_08440 [Bacteroidales bacterium]
MKLPFGIKSLTLPGDGGTILLIPEGIDNELLKSILEEQKNKIVLLGNSVGQAIFEDYKKKSKILKRLMEYSESNSQVYS